MTDWHELVAAKDWTGLEDLWRHLEQADAADVLQALRIIVPMVPIENGMERFERRALPEEVMEELKGAAKILMLGELEAYVEGDPPRSAAVWRDLRVAAEAFLNEASANAEATEGNVELSRKRHCDKAADCLRSLDEATRLAVSQMHGLDDEEWLQAVIAEVAADAYLAGRHVQAAWAKDFEHHAVRGELMLRAAAEGGRRRKGKLGKNTEKTIAEMDRLIAQGKTVRAAAQILSRGDLGTADAIRQRYKRRRPKKVGT